MEDDLLSVTEQFDSHSGTQEIVFDDDTESTWFRDMALPFTIGYVSETHGVVDVGYT